MRHVRRKDFFSCFPFPLCCCCASCCPTEIMASLFHRKTLAERVREYKRTINKAERDLDRERTKLQGQERKLISEIKSMAKKGQMDAAKIMAKDLVRTRRYITKFFKMKTHLQAISLKLVTLQSSEALARVMKNTTKAMQQMNKSVNIPALQKVMMDFEKQSDQMDMKEEMMGDTLDDVMGDEEEDEESEQVVGKVLAELGLEMTGEFKATPEAVASTSKQAEAAAVDADLQARFDNLGRNS